MNSNPHEYLVSQEVKESINNLVNILVKDYRFVNEIKFLKLSRFFAYQLPKDLINEIIEFYRDENGDGYLIIRNLAKINDDELGDTPENWRQNDSNPNSIYLDFIVVLILALICEPVAYAEQRPNGGGIVHDVIPINGDDVKQIGSGSSEELILHTEDITLQNSCDFVALLCVRNHESALNSLSILNKFNLSDNLKEILFKDEFVFPPDPNYEQIHHNTNYSKIKRSILFGNKKHPYIRVAPFDMIGKTEISDEAEKALIELNFQIELNKTFVQINSGDLLLLNNKRVLHGRASYNTSFSKKKRWIKRALGICDLMRASEFRDFKDPYIITEKSF